MPEKTAYSNRLIHETSPYLLQHAHNPVDWHPWGEEAFAEARLRDLPVFLSSGYSACHWCHVMERESFADPETAALINANFVPVKLDREERPDVDQVYMDAVQALTGQGGWPLSVFLAPDGAPFFGGTYYPPVPSYGRPSFRQVLAAIADAWRVKREALLAAGREIADLLAREMESGMADSGRTALDPDLVQRGVARLAASVDRRHGGFGRAPKFPTVSALLLMVRHSAAGGAKEPLELALMTLRRMARGGIHDQLGGGFHRYSTDDRWLVPHFEKMLYDNALLLEAYAIAYQIAGEREFAETARGIIRYLRREMRAPDGAFYASQDADSEGEEGRFYLWSPDSLREALENERLFMTARQFYGLDEGDPQPGGWVLRQALSPAEIAEASRRPADEIRADLREIAKSLYAARERRIRPFRDEKIILGWNGLALSGLCRAAQALGDPSALAMARTAAQFILERMSEGDWHLQRIHHAGRARIPAFLDDYAGFIRGLIDLYETDFDRRWLAAALGLQRTAQAEFSLGAGRYAMGGSRNEALFARAISAADQAMPSGLGMHCWNLLRLYALTGEEGLAAEAAEILRAHGGEMESASLSQATLLEALEMSLRRPVTIAVVGLDREGEEILRRLQAVFLPYRVMAGMRRGEAAENDPAAHLLRGRPVVEGKTTFHVCSDRGCAQPQTDWPGLERILAAAGVCPPIAPPSRPVS